MTPATNSKPRKNIAVLFGGRSVEHEISVITALQLMQALDVTRFNIVPVYIAPSGHWYTGEALFKRDFYKQVPAALKTVTEVTLFPWPDSRGLEPVREGFFSGLLSLVKKQPRVIPVDVYIPAFHGEFGEDGCMQGLLEMANAAYTSCDVAASSIAMNKHLCKSVLRDHGVKVLPAASSIRRRPSQTWRRPRRQSAKRPASIAILSL